MTKDAMGNRSPAQEVDQTLELFCAGIEFAAKWHEQEATKEDIKGWSERAKDHRYHAEDLRTLARKVAKA